MCFNRFGSVTGLRVLIAATTALFATEAPADSTGIVVESVTDYGPNDQLPNAIPNGNGFLTGITFSGSRFVVTGNWQNNGVYDTDFVDREVDSRGADSSYFDRPGVAVAYFSGHGTCQDGCSTGQRCSSTAACRTPNTAIGERLPAACRFSPFDQPRCCYMANRQAVTHSTNNRFNGIVNYSAGPIRWGESQNSGAWGGAGSDGGANLVVLDISCGVLPPFWAEAFTAAHAGTQLFATIMVAGGDTASVPDRGATFAKFFRANQNAKVSDSWQSTMNSLPANEGGACPGGGGGHGINGCGCNIIIGFDNSEARANGALEESWVALTHDSNDAFGSNWFAARWTCNYRLPAGGPTAWVLP